VFTVGVDDIGCTLVNPGPTVHFCGVPMPQSSALWMYFGKSTGAAPNQTVFLSSRTQQNRFCVHCGCG